MTQVYSAIELEYEIIGVPYRQYLYRILRKGNIMQITNINSTKNNELEAFGYDVIYEGTENMCEEKKYEL